MPAIKNTPCTHHSVNICKNLTKTDEPKRSAGNEEDEDDTNAEHQVIQTLELLYPNQVNIFSWTDVQGLSGDIVQRK